MADRVQTGLVTADSDYDESADFNPNGEAVCWLSQVCPECGALIEEQVPTKCWRCGVLVLGN